jgi:biopolymer transport protein ExbB/TolQ
MTDEMDDPLDRIEKTARDLQQLMHQNRSIGNATQTFSVNAGSPAMWIAVWISTICCAIVVTMTWNWREDQTKQMISSQEQARKLDNANDKLSIILQWAPKLAKEVDDEMKQKEIDHAHDKP